MSLQSRRFSTVFLTVTAFALIGVSCAGIPASQVRIVRLQSEIPNRPCESVGLIEANANTSTAEQESDLRTRAAARGADTVILDSHRYAATNVLAADDSSGGRADAFGYNCRAPFVGSAAQFGNTTGTYGPPAPQIEYTPPGGPQPVQSRN